MHAIGLLFDVDSGLTFLNTFTSYSQVNPEPNPNPGPNPNPNPDPNPNPSTPIPNPKPTPNQVRAHIRRGKMLVLPILSSTAPLDLSSETRLV